MRAPKARLRVRTNALAHRSARATAWISGSRVHDSERSEERVDREISKTIILPKLRQPIAASRETDIDARDPMHRASTKGGTPSHFRRTIILPKKRDA
jgi:hypothetical protein